MKDCPEKSPHFILLGASMNTGNLGVSALLASTVKCLLNRHPGAKIDLLDGLRKPVTEEVKMADGGVIQLGCVGIRCNKTFWRPNHILRLLLTALLLRLIPKSSWREKLRDRNPYLNAIGHAHLVADITGGDSFSDIYGMRRLILGSLRKMLVLAAGAELVLLPQTYGPFKSFWARLLVRMIIKRAAAVYSRDQQGLEELARLIGQRRMKAKLRFYPDVAFVLDAIAPSKIRTLPKPLPEREGKTLIGFNISGLLFNGGYTRNNMFGLQADYPQLVHSLIEEILRREDAVVLLVPHVFPPAELVVESDPEACREVYQNLHDRYPERVFCLEGRYDQSEIKYIVGLCDFFVGSRMHACIAAISQCIPAVAIAYSKKFEGVFESVALGDCVADARRLGDRKLVDLVIERLAQKDDIHHRLEKIIPEVKERIMNIFPKTD